MADAGIGEAMLLSAAIGGGSAAIQGQDPLRGALLGGALGGLGAYGAGQFGSMFGTEGAALAAGEGAASAFAPEVAAGIDYSGLIPTETGFFDPSTLSDVAAAANTPQSLAANQINAMTNLSPEMKQMFTNNLASGIDPTETVKQAATYNRYFQGAPSGIAGLGEKAANFIGNRPVMAGATLAGFGTMGNMFTPRKLDIPQPERYSGPLSYFKYDPRNYSPDIAVPPNPPYRAQYAGGGIASLPVGPIERMNQNAIGGSEMYPQSQIEKTYFATPTQMPTSAEVVGADYDAKTHPYTGEMMAKGGVTSLGGIDDLIEEAETTAGGIAALHSKARSDDPNALAAVAKMRQKKDLEDMMKHRLAKGGVSHLGSYSDGGRMLKGPGDGMSDSIPATIGGKQPARLAEGEFVVPADVVSHLGNGSTDAGAKKLYGMMDKVRKARTGTKKQGREINPNKFMPA